MRVSDSGHLSGCAVGLVEGQPGHTDGTRHEWPGAFCLKCGLLDPVEMCLAGPCHEHDFGDLKS
jgi:hypothetical protein